MDGPIGVGLRGTRSLKVVELDSAEKRGCRQSEQVIVGAGTDVQVNELFGKGDSVTAQAVRSHFA